jgi:hypothetical protein
MILLLKITSNFAELYSRLLVISFALLLLLPSFSFYVPNSVVAQTSETFSSSPQATASHQSSTAGDTIIPANRETTAIPTSLIN